MSEISKTLAAAVLAHCTLLRKELLTERPKRAICERVPPQSAVTSLPHPSFILQSVSNSRSPLCIRRRGRDPDRLLSPLQGLARAG